MFKSFMYLLILSSLGACTFTTPIAVTSNKIGDKVGKACSRTLLFIPFSSENDSSTYKAAKNGKIDTISTVDHEAFFTGIYNSRCTVVRGFGKGESLPQSLPSSDKINVLRTYGDDSDQKDNSSVEDESVKLENEEEADSSSSTMRQQGANSAATNAANHIMHHSAPVIHTPPPPSF